MVHAQKLHMLYPASFSPYFAFSFAFLFCLFSIILLYSLFVTVIIS
jgi:hypothetical protein